MTDEFNKRTTWFAYAISRWVSAGEDLPPAPTELHVGLHTGDPTEEGNQNEIQNADYNRASITPSNMSITGSNPHVITNDVSILFDEAGTDWGSVSHGSVWTDSGDPLYWGEFSEVSIVNTGERFELRPGDLVVSEY